MKKRNSLLMKFSLIYFSFALIMLVVSGLATYFSQMDNYLHECEKRIRDVGQYMSELMINEGDDIARYQDYYMEHYRELEIPYDFDDYGDAYYAFEEIFSETYPGMVMGEDIELEDTTKEVQDAYFIYSHEYWLLTYEMARDAFDLPYTYYLVLGDERCRRENLADGEDYGHSVTYLIDGKRQLQQSDEGEKLLFLGDTKYNSAQDNPILWKTWETGRRQDGYKEWDNEDGHTWSYYTPVVIDGEKLGVVVTEVDVKSFNSEIVMNAVKDVILTAAVMLTGFILMFIILKRGFVNRLSKLERVMGEYSEMKDRRVVDELDFKKENGDEIDMLSLRLSDMIDDLTDYMNSLVNTTRQLQEAEEREVELRQMVNIDSLTGIRNKNSYDHESENIMLEIKEGIARFGIGIADLNYLKKINDSFGHENGNAAIKNLCKILCDTFKHSQVFRIGGDEFAIILKNEDYDNAAALCDEFLERTKRSATDDTGKPWKHPSAAIGYALYNPSRDRTVKDVFKRADAAMYEQKQKMHAVRE